MIGEELLTLILGPEDDQNDKNRRHIKLCSSLENIFDCIYFKTPRFLGLTAIELKE